MPYQINARGTIVGVCTGNGRHGMADRAFVWAGGKTMFIESPGLARSQAFAINDSGTVVGERGTRAFVWLRGKASELSTPGFEESTAYGVNDSGVIVGQVYTLNGKTKACIWRRGKLSVLPDLGGSINEARAVNKSGDIVGLAQAPNAGDIGPGLHVVLWHRGKLYDLTTNVPLLTSIKAVAISGFNSRGDIVLSDPSSAMSECYLLAHTKTTISSPRRGTNAGTPYLSSSS